MEAMRIQRRLYSVCIADEVAPYSNDSLRYAHISYGFHQSPVSPSGSLAPLSRPSAALWMLVQHPRLRSCLAGSQVL
jgi:hypothetical protein